MDPLNMDTLLHSDALPKNVIFLPACSLIPSRTPKEVELRGPHLDGILTMKFASHRDVNIMLDIFKKSTAYFSSTQQAYQEVKYVAAGGKAADIRTQEVVDFSKDIHGVGLGLGLSRNGKSISVRSIAPGSPAALCDSVISVHDHLLKVDDVDVKHSCSTLEDVGKLIRGIRGTTVKLQLRRSRDVEEARQQDLEQTRTAYSPILTQAKSKYEVTLRRQPAVDPNAMLCDGVTSGAESLEADGNEGKQLADGDLKAVGQANAGMRNSDRETPEIEWLQEQQELPDTDVYYKQSISNAGSFNRLNTKVLTLSRQPKSNLEDYTQPQQFIDHLRLMSDQTAHREAVSSRSGGSVLTEPVGSGRVLMDSIRSDGLTDEHSKIRNPYSSILARAGETRRLTRSEMIESSAALPGPSTGLEVRVKPENTYSNIIQRAGERQARTSVMESSAALLGKPEKALGSFYLSDIGIAFYAVDGRHVVQGVLPNAPLSVHHNVCVLDELLSVDGQDVTRTSPDGVAALLKAKSMQTSFCFVEFLFCDSNADSNIQLTFNRNSTIVRFV